VVAASVFVAVRDYGSLPANELAARAAAQALLAQVRLPPGAKRSVVEPAGDLGALAHPRASIVAAQPGIGGGTRPATAGDVVDDYAFWTISRAHLSPADVIDEVSHDRYLNETVLRSEEGAFANSSDTEFLTENRVDIVWPAITQRVDVRDLEVQAVQLQDGNVGIRVDALATPYQQRPASERIPSGASRMVMRAGPNSWSGYCRFGGPETVVTVTSAATIRRVVALLNSLPLASDELLVGDDERIASPSPPGWPGCVPVLLQMTFATKGARVPLAVAAVYSGLCGGLQLTIRGHTEPVLGAPYPNCPPATPLTASPTFLGRLLAAGVNYPPWLSLSW